MRRISRAARTASKAALALGTATTLAGTAALLGVAVAPAAAAPADTGSCRPSAEHQYPVVLLHGTIDDATAWDVLGPRLTTAGYCVFAPTYGAGRSPIPLGGGTAALAWSADEMTAYIDGVLAQTGADQIDIVGHSQGGTIAEYYAKNLGHARRVHSELLLAVVTHGTTLMGLTDLVNQVPPVRNTVDTDLIPLFCAACADLEAGSDFMRALNTGPIAQPGVRYAVLATRDDTTSTPAGAVSFIDEPGVTNEFVQDLHAGTVTHQQMPRNATVVQWVLDRLG